jgi:hypothetical protein
LLADLKSIGGLGREAKLAVLSLRECDATDGSLGLLKAVKGLLVA